MIRILCRGAREQRNQASRVNIVPPFAGAETAAKRDLKTNELGLRMRAPVTTRMTRVWDTAFNIARHAMPVREASERRRPLEGDPVLALRRTHAEAAERPRGPDFRRESQ